MGFIRSEDVGLPEEKKKMVATQGQSNEAEIESLRDQRVSALKSKGKSNEAEIESLRDQRVSALESKADDLTKEMDTLCTKQNKKSAAAAPLKEESEIISQVMAKVEELSKKQAAQESQIRKLTAQIREFEEEKKGLNTKLQVEENEVEGVRRDKAATEKLLQETIEKLRVELAAQKEYYTNALNAAKEAEALAEAQASNEARTAKEREIMLVQELEDLRQTLSRKEQQAFCREDMFHGNIKTLEKLYQAVVCRCEELVVRAYESDKPLYGHIKAMQETADRKAEDWFAVKRSLISQLQEVEGTAAAAEERERSMNEHLSQALSRINVLEAQISCLRTEQTQLTRSLEKERQGEAESRQEYLALKEEADTHEGHVNQLEAEIRELKRKLELSEALMHRELLQQASMESIRDSLAEELVKLTEQCKKFRGEASMPPGVQEELEALRRRHSAALELMGECGEKLEELRALILWT